MDPNYVSGFCDGEGSFAVKLRTGEKSLLDEIKSFFGGGRLNEHSHKSPEAKRHSLKRKLFCYYKVVKIYVEGMV